MSDANQPAKRVRTSTAHVDIDNAFIAWFNATGWGNLEASEADNRVKVWLAQVEAEQRQLRAALLACQALAAVTDYADVDAIHAARKLAMDAISEG